MLLSNLSPAWLISASLLVVLGALYLLNRFRIGRLENTINAQKEVIKHQEQVIVGLEESLRNAEIKKKHDEVARSISDDALRERMQSEGYYRD